MFTHQEDPFLILMPLKLEIIMTRHLSLYVFHSVFNSKRIHDIQEYIDLMVCKCFNTRLESEEVQRLFLGSSKIIMID